MKTVRMIDTTNLVYYTQGKEYNVKGETTGDFYDYYLLMADDGIQRWVGKYRVAEVIRENIKCNSGTAIPYDFPYIKSLNKGQVNQVIERVISVPDENGHIVDLQRIQYISPIDKGSYSVTLVSGWGIPLTDEVYSREKLIGLWKALQNKEGLQNK